MQNLSFVVRSIRYLVIKKEEEDNSHFTRFYDVNTYLQEVKNLCLMQVSHKAQPDKENVAEHYVLSKKMKKVFLNKLNSYLKNNSNKLQDMRSPIFSILQESFHVHMRLIRFHVMLCP